MTALPPSPWARHPQNGQHFPNVNQGGQSQDAIQEQSAPDILGNDRQIYSDSPQPLSYDDGRPLRSHIQSPAPTSGLSDTTEKSASQDHVGLLKHGDLQADSIPRSSSEPVAPHAVNRGGNLASVERCAELLEASQDGTMLLDVRPYTHFAQGSIKGALNLCIPTTLLKRPSFNTQKLEGTFKNELEKARFAKWKTCKAIIVYDGATADLKDAAPLLNVLKKFTTEGWNGNGLVLRGGFRAFSNRFPGAIQSQQHQPTTSTAQPTRMEIDPPSSAPVAGGCALPESSTIAIPFFDTIRQNMDLVGGVGQIALKLPELLTESKEGSLPVWLRAASEPNDAGHQVSAKFLDLEKRELARMQKALSQDRLHDGPSSDSLPIKFRVAGIEKGTKNRYKNVFPFEHSRVRLQDVPVGGCDYVNASLIKAEHSSTRYIATQAPVPDTFNDFWHVVWQQDVRLLVSLTAEVEQGHVKCHPYWATGQYGSIRVEKMSEEYIHLEPELGDGILPLQQGAAPNDNPHIIIRHFTLSSGACPSVPPRDITQLHYPHWPDFGTASHPLHILRLIEQCDIARRTTGDLGATCSGADAAEPRSVLVHCSAGCGRTGAFCTVDSVLSILKEKQAQGAQSGLKGSDLQTPDLIAQTVEEFRTQRPGMVQNLGQFVLCYESILEWIISQVMKERSLEAQPSPVI